MGGVEVGNQVQTDMIEGIEKTRLVKVGLGDFIGAKVDDWLQDRNHCAGALLGTATGLVGLAGAAEAQANRLQKMNRLPHSALKRGVLHAISLTSLAGAGIILNIEGYTSHIIWKE